MGTHGMKGWTELAGDVSWEDYGGMWTKKARDGSYYVLKFTNLWEAAGKEDGFPQYECEVKRIDFTDLPMEEIDSALRCCGFKRISGPLGLGLEKIVDEHSGDILADTDTDVHQYFLVLVQCCIDYGIGAPLESLTSDHRPLNVRAKARRYAEQCMKDGDLLDARLDRSVNAIGSTAREYGKGDINAALRRDSPGTNPVAMGIMRKMHGIDPAEELKVATIVTMKRSDLLKCPFAIILPEHYRQDGSCRCDDLIHRAKMVREWGYSTEDFADFDRRQAANGK